MNRLMTLQLADFPMSFCSKWSNGGNGCILSIIENILGSTLGSRYGDIVDEDDEVGVDDAEDDTVGDGDGDDDAT